MIYTVSVIVTNYNNANLLSNCLGSVLNSSYENLEVIFIDDCSEDNSLNLVGDFKNPKLKILKNDYNVGAGMSRRKAIMASTGDYVMFVDSDDSIDRLFIETLLKEAIEKDADIVEGGVRFTTGKIWKRCNSVIEGAYEKVNYFLNKELKFVNTGLYRKSLIDLCPEYCDRPYIEDTPSYIPWLLKANKVVVVDYPGYIYYENPNSLTHTASRYKGLLFDALGKLDIYKACKDYGIGLLGSEEDIVKNFRGSLKFSGAYLDYNPEFDIYIEPIMNKYK